MNSPQHSEVAMAWYRRDQWALLRAVSADGQSLEETYEAWLAFATKQVRDLEARGFLVHKIEVEIGALTRWCESEAAVSHEFLKNSIAPCVFRGASIFAF